MKVEMLDKVKDSHNLLIKGEKGPEIMADVKLFEKGEVVESNDFDIPEERLAKLAGYGFAKVLDD